MFFVSFNFWCIHIKSQLEHLKDHPIMVIRYFSVSDSFTCNKCYLDILDIFRICPERMKILDCDNFSVFSVFDRKTPTIQMFEVCKLNSSILIF